MTQLKSVAALCATLAGLSQAPAALALDCIPIGARPVATGAPSHMGAPRHHHAAAKPKRRHVVVAATPHPAGVVAVKHVKPHVRRHVHLAAAKTVHGAALGHACDVKPAGVQMSSRPGDLLDRLMSHPDLKQSVSFAPPVVADNGDIPLAPVGNAVDTAFNGPVTDDPPGNPFTAPDDGSTSQPGPSGGNPLVPLDTPKATAVPEPGAWALMITGVFWLGAMLRSARRSTARQGA